MMDLWKTYMVNPGSGNKFGNANPPGYKSENYLNQYGRLKGTGGQALRNF